MSNCNLMQWNVSCMFLEEVCQVFDCFFQVEDGDVFNVVISQWVLCVDICEDEQWFVILVDIFGVDLVQIEVSMEKGILIIKGECQVLNGDNGKYIWVEWVYGVFYCCFMLLDSVDVEGIIVKGKFGVLEIVILKKLLVMLCCIIINVVE